MEDGQKRDTKKQDYLLTINNPSPEEEDVEKILMNSELKEYVRYCVWAREEGEQEKTPHIHILLFLSEQQRFSAVKKLFPRARIEEELLGSRQQCLDYIGNPEFTYSDSRTDEKAGKKKGGVCIYKKSFGSLQGIRLGERAGKSSIDARLEALQAHINDGKQLQELYDIDFPVMIRYGKQLSEYACFVASKKRVAFATTRDLLEAEEYTRDKMHKAIQEEVERLNLEPFNPNALVF